MVAKLTGSEPDRMWIGARDAAHESQWAARTRMVEQSFTYFDSVPLTYTNWAAGMPDGGPLENCAEMWTTGEWNDASCGESKAFVCSKMRRSQV